LAFLVPYRISALGLLLDQLTLKLVAVTGLTVLLDRLGLQEFRQKLITLSNFMTCDQWLNEAFASAHPENSCLFHKFPCRSNLALLHGGFGFRTVEGLMSSPFQPFPVNPH